MKQRFPLCREAVGRKAVAELMETRKKQKKAGLLPKGGQMPARTPLATGIATKGARDKTNPEPPL